MLAALDPLISVFLARAGLADMTDEQASAQFIRLVIASALLPWGWLFLRSSVVFGMLGILQVALVGYCTFRAYRFLRARIQRLGLRVVASAAIYCLLCVTTNELGVAIVFLGPDLLRSLAK